MKKAIPVLALFACVNLASAAPTTNSGQQYINECLAAGVPVPVDSPMYGDDWEMVGYMQGEFPNSEEFISEDEVGEIWIYRSQPTPDDPDRNRGVCLALPRYDISVDRNGDGTFGPPQDGDPAVLFGLICMEQNPDDNNASPPALNSACYFDNPNGVTFPRGEEVSVVTDLIGGQDLVSNGQGVCTDCHSGENPFVVHPNIEAFASIASELTTPTGWVDPIIGGGWPENPGPNTYLDQVESAGSCVTCHALPELTELPGYCSERVILQAIGKTMPPIGDVTAYAAHIDAIDTICSNQDFLAVLSPTATQVARAGAFNDPGKILVQVKPPLPNFYTLNDYTVTIGAVPAEVAAVLNVDRDAILVVQPGIMPNEGLFDLSVAVGGQFADNDISTSSVQFEQEGIPVDLTIVGDVSGSMGQFGKLEAAQNAARLWVDHAGVGDQIGVVKFSSVAETQLNLTAVNTEDSSDPARTSAKQQINLWEPETTTAMGEGILQALALFEAQGRSETDAEWRMALLTDGLENVGRLWSDANGFVKGEVANATDSQGNPHSLHIDVVALGPDADNAIAADVVSTTEGDLYAITPLDTSTAFFSPNKANLLPVFETTTPGDGLGNRLADIYKRMAEKARLEQRIGDWNGILVANGDSDIFQLTLESGLPEITIAVNWNQPAGNLRLRINGEFCTAIQNAERVGDSTHEQCRIQTPTPGLMQIEVLKPEPQVPVVTGIFEDQLIPVQELPAGAVEYKLMVSAYSHTSILPVYLDESTNQGDDIRVVVYVGDDNPIAGTLIQVSFTDSTGSTVTIPLFDDGQHSDGDAGDGLYGNTLQAFAGSGAISTEIIGVGTSNGGIPFFRKDKTAIYVAPRLLLPVSVYAAENLFVSDRANIFASVGAEIYAGNYLELGADAMIFGDVSVGGNIFMRSRSKIDGDLVYGSNVDQQTETVITGTISQQNPIPEPVIPFAEVNPGTQNIELGNDQSGTWEPGRYGDAVVRARSTLILKEGEYHFKSLNIEPNATVFLEASGRNTVILVEGNLQFGNGSPIFANNTAFATFYSNSTNTVNVGTDLNFNGTLIVPNGSVSVFSRTSMAKIAAKNIRIEPDAQLNASK